MDAPDLLVFETEGEYSEYYKREYCYKETMTFDGIRVYFSVNSFPHAFYECSARDGRKDVFSAERAQRLSWIRATIENPGSELFQGWVKKNGKYDPNRRVCVVYEDFVVVLAMRINKKGVLVANFVTCYQADNSITKIKSSPKWLKEDCLAGLKKKAG